MRLSFLLLQKRNFEAELHNSCWFFDVFVVAFNNKENCTEINGLSSKSFLYIYLRHEARDFHFQSEGS